LYELKYIQVNDPDFGSRVLKSEAYREGYRAEMSSSQGPIQTYPNNPYDFRKNLKEFWDWQMGSARAQADLMIASCKSEVRIY